MTLLVSTVLMLYLSWMISIRENQNAQFYSLLSKILCYMITVPSQNLKQYVISAHHHSLLQFFQYDKYQTPSDCLEYLRDFYSMQITFPPDSFDLIYVIFNLSLQSNQPTFNLFAYIEILCEELDTQFPTRLAEEITLLIMHSISRLEISSLSLFSHLSKRLSFETKAKIFSIFGNSIWLYLTSNPPFLQFKQVYSNHESTPPISPTVSFSLSFWDGPGFSNGVNLNQQISFPETVSLAQLLSNEMTNRITLIHQASINEPFLISTLIDSLSELMKKVKNEKHLLDFGVTFLLYCSLSPDFVRQKEANILMDPPLFHPSMTVFQIKDNDEYKIINTIRYYVIQILMKSKINIINDIFMKWIHEPLLFAEIIHRIIQSTTLASFDFNDPLNSDKIQSLCHALMISSLYYQELHYSVEESKIESIEIARTSILLLISSLFNAPNALSFLFSDSSFDSFYLSFLFEVQLRGFVLSNLLSFLSNLQTKVPDFILGILKQILKICLSSIPEEKYVLLVNDILSTLNESFLHQRSITESFISFIPSLFSSFQKVEKKPVIEDFIMKCIQFFSLVAHPKSISRSNYEALSKAISIVFDKENIPQKLTVKIIQLIAGDKLPSLAPSFCIRHPKAVNVLLYTVLNDSKILEIIKFIDSLVLYLHYNSIQLRHAKFDLFLIQIIRQQKNEEVINALLTLFQHIASTVSNISVVQNYISLLSPFENQFYSNYQKNYILTMNKIVSASAKDPIASIPMINPSNAIEITGLTKQDIDKGFTFVFWILNDHAQAQYKPSCLFLQDSKMNTINAFISSSYIFCYEKINGMNSTGKIDHAIPSNQWTFVALTFDFKSPSVSYVIPTFGVNSLDPVEYIPMNFQQGPMICKIGGTTENSINSDCISKIATFGMFDILDQDSITFLSQMGPRGFGNLPHQPLFYYTIDEINGLLSVKEEFALSNLKYQTNLDEIPRDENFTKILVDFCKCQILLPLYSQIDMTMKNGNKFLIEKVTNELIGNLLTSSKNAQFSFYISKGAEILSYLLKSCNDSHIDYALYLQYYSIMQGVTYLSLQEQILKIILLDVELWLKADADNHARILKHWDRTLFPSMMTNLTTTFKSILLYMRIYYWYELIKEEKEYAQCLNRCRGEELNVFECRQLLSRIAVKIAIENFDKEDFVCLINHCLTCAEIQQIIDLLRIIKSLALSSPSPLNKISSDTDFISFMYLLLPRENDNLLILIFEIIITLYYHNLVSKPSLQDQIRYTIEQISPSRISKNLFYKAVESIKNGYFEMLQVCCWMALNDSIDSSLISKMITNQIRPMKEFVTNPTWSFWPIVFCFHVDSTDDVCYQLILFLSICSFSEWKTLFNMIHDVGIILNKNSNELKSLLLHSIIQIINSNPEIDEDQLSSFFVISRRFILYRKSNENSLATENAYINSPFNYPDEKQNDDNDNDDSIPIPKDISIDDFVPITLPKVSSPKPRRTIGSLTVSSRMIPRIPIILKPQTENNEQDSSTDKNLSYKDKIKNSQFPSDILQFGLRFDEKVNWVDADLAKEIISIYQSVQIPQFLSFDLILCAFLMHESPEFVCDHIMQLDILSNVDYETNIGSSTSTSFLPSFSPFTNTSTNTRLYHVGSLQSMIQPSSSNIMSSGSFNNFDNDSSEFSNSYVFNGGSKLKVQNYIDLLNHHCRIVGFDYIIEPSNEHTVSNNAFKCIQKLSFPAEGDLVAAAKRLFTLIKQETEDSPQKNINTFYFVLGDLVGENRSKIINSIDSIRQNKKNYEKSWNKLWRSLSIVPAPWSYNLNNINKTYYKRDQISCYSLCPFKMKRNWKYNIPQLSASRSDFSDNPMKKHRTSLPNQLLDVSISNSSNESSSLCIIPCKIITVNNKKPAKLVLFNDRIELLTFNGKAIIIPLNEIVHIFFRKTLFIPNSIEIFTIFGKSFFIEFLNHKSLSFLKNINSSNYLQNIIILQTTNFYEYFQKKNKTMLWCRDKISNFEYLMHLNTMSGRSFNDITQYPIFPWIITDYMSETINLNDVAIYRDLKRPIGELNEEKLRKIKNKMKDKNYLFENSMLSMENVYSYLFRIEPFSSLPIQTTDSSVLLSSISESFNSVVNDLNENRELTPEFYFNFEFLKNSNKINEIDDVVLPPWANKSRFVFVYTMRKALESEICSNMLNDWIDLVWGYKQRGEESIKSNNTFKPSLYDSVWQNDRNNNGVEVEENVVKSGQIPPQLFTSKHPVKIVNLSNICPFNSTFTIHCTKVKLVKLARIDLSGEWIFKITEIDPKGFVLINTVDLSHKKKNCAARTRPNHFTITPSRSGQFNHIVGRTQSSSSSLLNKAENDDFSPLFERAKTEEKFPLIRDISSEKDDKSSTVSDEVSLEIDADSPSSPTLGNIHSFNSFDFKRRFSQNVTFSKAEMPRPKYNEETLDKDVSISSITKEIKGFSEINFDVFQHPNTACEFGKSKLLLVSFQSCQLFSIDLYKSSIEKVDMKKVTGVSSSGDFIAISKQDSVLDIYKNNLQNRLFSLPSYGDTINCCCLSSNFYTAIIGTRNNFSLILYSLTNGEITRVIDLNGAKPFLVTITKSWGFIVCYASKMKEDKVKNYIFLFSINGELIKKTKIGFQICSWCSWSSSKDFDYMAVSDEKGNLYAFEVFECENMTKIAQCESKVLSLNFFMDIDCIVAVAQNGHILFIPYNSIF